MFSKNDPSINRAGRPPQNKVQKVLRESIQSFLNENFEQVKIDFVSLPAKDRAKLYVDLLRFGLPELKSIEITDHVREGSIMLLPDGTNYRLS